MEGSLEGVVVCYICIQTGCIIYYFKVLHNYSATLYKQLFFNKLQQSNLVYKIPNTYTGNCKNRLHILSNTPYICRMACPPPKNEFFYFENGLLVFTEKYHLNRGYCCKNGCRHCPYGFKKGKESIDRKQQMEGEQDYLPEPE